MHKCANCNALILFGKSEANLHFCNQICMEHFAAPHFCEGCLAETSSKEVGSTFTLNGIGSRLYGAKRKCPKCFAVDKTLWFCILFIPIIPLGEYRIKSVTANKYRGRQLRKQGESENSSQPAYRI